MMSLPPPTPAAPHRLDQFFREHDRRLGPWWRRQGFRAGSSRRHHRVRLRSEGPAVQVLEVRGSAVGDKAGVDLLCGVHFPEAAELLGFLEVEGAWRKIAMFCLVEGVIEGVGGPPIEPGEPDALSLLESRVMDRALPWLERLKDPEAALHYLEERLDDPPFMLPAAFEVSRAAALALWLGCRDRASAVFVNAVRQGLSGGFEAPPCRFDLWNCAYRYLEALGWALHQGLDLPDWPELDAWLVQVANADKPGVRAEAPDREAFRERLLRGWRASALEFFEERRTLEEAASDLSEPGH